MGMVNSFLLKTDDGLLMIDAGWPNKTEKIFAAVQESGHNPADITREALYCRLLLGLERIPNSISIPGCWRRSHLDGLPAGSEGQN